MRELLGVHVTTTTYGTWLPGDGRGHWSPILGPDGRLTYSAGGPLPGDARTEQRARERMKHQSVLLNTGERTAVVEAFRLVADQYGYSVYAVAVQANHVHWVVAGLGEEVSVMVGRFKGIAGKAVRVLRGPGPVWTEGYFKVFLFEEQHAIAAIQYVERHNLESGLPARPGEWVRAWR